MKTSSFIVMAGATLLAATTIGAGLVRAFPTAPVPAPSAAAEKAPYVWRGLWGAEAAIPAGDRGDCAMRKVWAETPDGLRLKWRRACAPAG